MATIKQQYAIAFASIIVYVLSAVLVFHTFAAASLWWWQWVSVFPGWAWLLVPALALLIFLLRNRNFLMIGCFLITLPLAFAQADINISALWGRSEVAPSEHSVRVFSWNSLAWRQTDKRAWTDYIKSHDADIYFLQEVIQPQRWNTPAPDDLIAAFPGYRTVPFGEWIIMTRLPVVGVYSTEGQFWLRVDVDIQGRRVSLYNVHIPVHIIPHLAMRDPGRFFETMKGRFELRAEQFTLLEEDLASNTYSKIIAGDFNTTRSMGRMGTLLNQYTDVSSYGNDLFPATWGDYGLILWRIDWALISKELTALSYKLLPDTAFSDHRAQVFQIEVPPLEETL